MCSISRRNWNIIVCIIVRLNVGDQQQKQQFSLKWKLDSCDGPRNSVKYRYNNTYWDRCCLNPGIYTLICKNDIGSFGWGNSFIEILGQRYCDDFAGYKAMRRSSGATKFFNGLPSNCIYRLSNEEK